MKIEPQRGGNKGRKNKGKGGMNAEKRYTQNLAAQNQALTLLPKSALPLSGKKMKQELRSASRLQFRPITRQLQGEKRAAQTAISNTQDYFDDYVAKVAALKGQSDAAYAQAQQNWQNTTNASTAADTANREKLAAEESKDAQTRGASTNPQNSQTAAAASASRRNVADSVAGTLGTQGASQSSYLVNRQIAGEKEKVNQLLKAEARKRSINQDQRQLKRERRDWLTDTRRQLRGDERDFYIQNRAFSEDRRAAKQSRKTQLAVSRQNAMNDAASDARYAATQASQQAATAAGDRKSYQRQKNLAGIYNQNEKRDDARGRRYQDQVGKGGKDAPTADEIARAKGILYEGFTEGEVARFLLNKENRQNAFRKLTSAGVPAAVARQVINAAVRPNSPGRFFGFGGGPPEVG